MKNPFDLAGGDHLSSACLAFAFAFAFASSSSPVASPQPVATGGAGGAIPYTGSNSYNWAIRRETFWLLCKKPKRFGTGFQPAFFFHNRECFDGKPSYVILFKGMYHVGPDLNGPHLMEGQEGPTNPAFWFLHEHPELDLPAWKTPIFRGTPIN